MTKLLTIVLASASFLSLASAAHAQEIYFRWGKGSIRSASNAPTTPPPSIPEEPDEEEEEEERYAEMRLDSVTTNYSDTNGNGIFDIGDFLIATFVYTNIGDKDLTEYEILAATLVRRSGNSSASLVTPLDVMSCSPDIVPPGQKQTCTANIEMTAGRFPTGPDWGVLFRYDYTYPHPELCRVDEYDECTSHTGFFGPGSQSLNPL